MSLSQIVGLSFTINLLTRYRHAKLLNFTIVPILFVVSIIFLSLLFAHTYIKNRHKLFGAMILCLGCMNPFYADFILFQLLFHVGISLFRLE